jgi:hypothetical protein
MAQAIRAVFAACGRTAAFIGRLAKIPRWHSLARSARYLALRKIVLAPSANILRNLISPSKSLLSTLAPRCRLIPFSRLLAPLECSLGVGPLPPQQSPAPSQTACPRRPSRLSHAPAASRIALGDRQDLFSSAAIAVCSASGKPRWPSAATILCSARWLRKQFMSCVRCLTRRSGDGSCRSPRQRAHRPCYA